MTIAVVDMRIPGSDPRFREELHAAGLPTDDLEEPGRIFFAYQILDGTLVGFGGYERFGDDALVRSVVVLQEARARGLGRNLLSVLLRRTFEDGARQPWLDVDCALLREGGVRCCPPRGSADCHTPGRQASNCARRSSAHDKYRSVK
jgi:GNAT superfamily N-acetyltransferase